MKIPPKYTDVTHLQFLYSHHQFFYTIVCETYSRVRKGLGLDIQSYQFIKKNIENFYIITIIALFNYNSTESYYYGII